VQLSRPALRPLLGPAACTGRQLLCLHDAGNRSRTRRGEDVRVSGSRRVSCPTPQSESGTALAWQRLLVRGGDSSCEEDTPRRGPSSRELVRGAPNWSRTGRLTSERLDRGLQPSSS
jgi:hypothetical protein